MLKLVFIMLVALMTMMMLIMVVVVVSCFLVVVPVVARAVPSPPTLPSLRTDGARHRHVAFAFFVTTAVLVSRRRRCCKVPCVGTSLLDGVIVLVAVWGGSCGVGSCIPRC